MLDDTKIREELGFQPVFTDPRIVIADSVNWLKENNFLDQKTKSEN